MSLNTSIPLKISFNNEFKADQWIILQNQEEEVWKNQRTGQKVLVYRCNNIDKILTNQLRKIHSQYIVQIIHVIPKNYFRNKHGQQQIVLVEYLEKNFSQIQYLTESQAIYSFLCILKALCLLYPLYGSLLISQTMIYINQQRKVKIWLNSNFQKMKQTLKKQTLPTKKVNSSLKQQIQIKDSIENVVNIIERKLRNNYKYLQLKQLKNCQTYKDCIDYLENIIMEYKILYINKIQSVHLKIDMRKTYDCIEQTRKDIPRLSYFSSPTKKISQAKSPRSLTKIVNSPNHFKRRIIGLQQKHQSIEKYFQTNRVFTNIIQNKYQEKIHNNNLTKRERQINNCNIIKEKNAISNDKVKYKLIPPSFIAATAAQQDQSIKYQLFDQYKQPQQNKKTKQQTHSMKNAFSTQYSIQWYLQNKKQPSIKNAQNAPQISSIQNIQEQNRSQIDKDSWLQNNKNQSQNKSIQKTNKTISHNKTTYIQQSNNLIKEQPNGNFLKQAKQFIQSLKFQTNSLKQLKVKQHNKNNYKHISKNPSLLLWQLNNYLYQTNQDGHQIYVQNQKQDINQKQYRHQKSSNNLRKQQKLLKLSVLQNNNNVYENDRKFFKEKPLIKKYQVNKCQQQKNNYNHQVQSIVQIISHPNQLKKKLQAIKDNQIRYYNSLQKYDHLTNRNNNKNYNQKSLIVQYNKQDRKQENTSPRIMVFGNTNQQKSKSKYHKNNIWNHQQKSIQKQNASNKSDPYKIDQKYEKYVLRKDKSKQVSKNKLTYNITNQFQQIDIYLQNNLKCKNFTKNI